MAATSRVKWTLENYQILLAKLVESHDISVDAKKIADAWPRDEAGNVPTARAISERLLKTRAEVAKRNGGNREGPNLEDGETASAAGTPKAGKVTPKAKAKPKAPRTPQKPKENGKGPSDSAEKAVFSNKRKRGKVITAGSVDSEAETEIELYDESIGENITLRAVDTKKMEDPFVDNPAKNETEKNTSNSVYAVKPVGRMGRAIHETPSKRPRLPDGMAGHGAAGSSSLPPFTWIYGTDSHSK